MTKKASSLPAMQSAFGASVRSMRNSLALSQEELAWRAGVHRTFVTNVERGVCNVSLGTIAKLAKALGTTAAALLGEAGAQASIQKRAGPAAPADAPVDILLVEDNPSDAELTLRALKMAKLANSVRVVHDGADALDYIYGTGSHAGANITTRPRLILLDLYLPKISGLEVLQRLKSGEQTRTTPVIVLTVSQQKRDIAESRRLGADAYIMKPVTFRGLTEAVPKLDLCWLLYEKPPAQSA